MKGIDIYFKRNSFLLNLVSKYIDRNFVYLRLGSCTACRDSICRKYHVSFLIKRWLSGKPFLIKFFNDSIFENKKTLENRLASLPFTC